MKKILQIITVLVTALLIYSTVSAQENAGITFSIIKKDGKIMAFDAKQQKVANFYIIGLNTTDEVNAFITKFKAQEGVIDITISNDLVDNKRVASATFYGGAHRAFLKKVLTNTGVQQVIIDGKTINTADIETKEAGNNATK